MYKELVEGKYKLAVIGLGYVGLPIALEYAKKIKVIGFDIKPERIEQMRQGIDPSNELESEAFENCDIYLRMIRRILRMHDFLSLPFLPPLMFIKCPISNLC